MKYLKHYWLVVTIFLIVVLFVLFRSFSRHDFRYDAARWAGPSVTGTNIITEEQISALRGEILLISLGNQAAAIDQLHDKTMKVNPESILEKGTLSVIRKNKGPVILFSDDSSVTARVWMVLSEMGMQNLYILHDEENRVY
ncbi:MAG: hypothetical protein MUC30_07680 [Bacteroidales bacterium]|jgi:hypothetical protein|nr:hypothetical protein [Bacteroidales bacterium]